MGDRKRPRKRLCNRGDGASQLSGIVEKIRCYAVENLGERAWTMNLESVISYLDENSVQILEIVTYKAISSLKRHGGSTKSRHYLALLNRISRRLTAQLLRIEITASRMETLKNLEPWELPNKDTEQISTTSETRSLLEFQTYNLLNHTSPNGVNTDAHLENTETCLGVLSHVNLMACIYYGAGRDPGKRDMLMNTEKMMEEFGYQVIRRLNGSTDIKDNQWQSLMILEGIAPLVGSSDYLTDTLCKSSLKGDGLPGTQNVFLLPVIFPTLNGLKTSMLNQCQQSSDASKESYISQIDSIIGTIKER